MFVDIFGKREIDLGCNDQEFWYWIGKAEPAHQFFCSFKDLRAGRVKELPFSFPPEWIMETMGLASYGPPERYKLVAEAGKLTLVEATRTPQGKRVRKLIVINRRP